MLEFIYRRLLIPAFESGVKRRRTFGYWRQLEESQWLSIEELRAHQLASLQRLLPARGPSTAPITRPRCLAALEGLDPGINRLRRKILTIGRSSIAT